MSQFNNLTKTNMRPRTNLVKYTPWEKIVTMVDPMILIAKTMTILKIKIKSNQKQSLMDKKQQLKVKRKTDTSQRWRKRKGRHKNCMKRG